MKRSFLIATAVILCGAAAAAIIALEDEQSGRKRQRRIIDRAQHFWLLRVPAYSDLDFHKKFRMPRPVFNRIVHVLSGEEAFLVAASRVGLALGVDQQLAIVLFRLGHGLSVSAVEAVFDVGVATISNMTWVIIPAIVRLFVSAADTPAAH